MGSRMRSGLLKYSDNAQPKHWKWCVTHLIVFQCHEVVMDILASGILLHSGFELFVIEHFTTVFQYKSVAKEAQERKKKALDIAATWLWTCNTLNNLNLEYLRDCLPPNRKLTSWALWFVRKVLLRAPPLSAARLVPTTNGAFLVVTSTMSTFKKWPRNSLFC